MPIGGVSDPQVDLDRLDEGATSLPVSQGTRYRVEAGIGDFTKRGLHWLGEDPIHGEPFHIPGVDIPVLTGPSPRISAQEANDRYGVDGYQRFNEPTTEYDAAFRGAQARERQFRDSVLSLSRPSPLADFGAGLGGALLDPAGLAVMGLTGGLGEAAFGAVGLGEAGAGALAIGRMGRVANAGFQAARVLGEGAIANAPYVAASGALTAYSGDDYTFGDGLRDIAAGAVLGGTVHLVGWGLRSARSRFADAVDPEEALRVFKPQEPAQESQTPHSLVPEGGIPQPVLDMQPVARAGAFAKAVDDMTDDRAVDVGDLVAHETARPDIARLDEPTADSAVASFRPLKDALAVTTRGTEIPVRYGLMELSDLTTSHDDNLSVNGAFPAELQPRDRGRAGAQARNLQLEKELNPKLMLESPDAAGGTPIVSPQGVVESGNGRAIALRRSAASGGEAWGRYVAELKAQGFDTAGLRQPVLVRMRSEPLTGSQRAALSREMNADVTERMSAGEQAASDAARIPDHAFDLVGDREGPATSKDFARAFIDQVAGDQVGQLVNADGTLSPEGARRIKAAVLARAYGDPRLVGQIFEGEETASRQLGEALADAAPAWAKMRALAARAEIPAALDLTDALTSAMDLVRYAAQEKTPLGQLIAERLGQTEMFAGEAISPSTEAFLRLFYRDETFTKPTSKEAIASFLKHYAGEASKVVPGPDLFGVTPGPDTARAILANLADRFARNDPGDIDIRPPGRAAGPAAAAPVIELRRLGDVGDRGGGGVPPQGGDAPEGAGRAARQDGAAIIAADPELKALADDTQALAAANGLEEIAPPAKEDPNTLAEALRATAICLAEEAT